MSQDLRIEKIRRDWETGSKQLPQPPALPLPLATLKGAASTSTVLPSGRSAVLPLWASPTSTQSEPVAKLPLSISRQSLDRALSITRSQWSRLFFAMPVLATESDLPMCLNTLKLFEAAASLQDLMQAEGQGKSSLPKPHLPDPQEEILIDVMGDSSPSGSFQSLESRAEGQGVRSGDPDILQSGLVHFCFLGWCFAAGPQESGQHSGSGHSWASCYSNRHSGWGKISSAHTYFH